MSETLNRPTSQETGPKTPDDPHGKRAQIIGAATDLFLAGGFSTTSMDAIARASNVSKATLYAYFASKEILFGEIVGTTCRAKWDLDEPMPADATPHARTHLTLIGNRLLRFFLRPETLAAFRIVITESPRTPELGRSFYQAGPQGGMDWMAGIFARLNDAGELTVPDPLAAADQFGSMLRGALFLRAIIGQETITEDEIERAVARTVETILRAYAPG